MMIVFGILYIVALLVCLSLAPNYLRQARQSGAVVDGGDVMVLMALSVIPVVNIFTALSLVYKRFE